ncbi:tetratricopeptide repeat protein [Hanstruepera ponticola]|uniref:tetratricopeptide repeat protein n=1 Tax=Hanstruepera ponticola TaxID=2042995 RepID=UPI0017851DAE|nr:tetratricopeptide repeat protein [Hanstruepera ponticola]
MNKEELIAKYIRNELSESEIKEIEELLDSDTHFKEQFEFETQIQKAIYRREHNKNKQFLKDIESKVSSKNSKTNWFLIAASIILLASLGFYWKQYTTSPERLFSNYYSKASNTSHPITRNQNDTDELTKAFIAYEREVYDQAQKLFNNLYKTSNNSELLFYEGICYLEIGQIDNAIKTFLKHQKFKDKLLGKSKWYLALAYLKNNNQIEAQNILEKITSSSSNYNFEKAKELLSDL